MEFTQQHAEAITAAVQRIKDGETSFNYVAVESELDIEAANGTLFFGVYDTPNSSAVTEAMTHARTLSDDVDYESGALVTWISLNPR